MDFTILKAAYHLHYRIHLANVAEKFVAHAFALRGAGHQPGDVHKLHGGRDDLRRILNRRQRLEPAIGHHHHADIRVDRAKRIIGRLRLARAGQCIEQRGFTDIRQPNNTSS